MILITGASGKLGGRAARSLMDTHANVRLMARDPKKLTQFPDAECVQADYSDIPSLDRAFAGISRAFIVSGYAAPGERAKLHHNAFEAAKRAGVEYIVYLSFLGAAPDSLFPMSRDHFESEQYLKATGVAHTILQDSFYSELSINMFNAEGVLKAPAQEGAVSWVGRDEVAEAVADLLGRAVLKTGTFPMTGPEALTLHDTAKVLTRLTGRSLTYQPETLVEARASRSKLTAMAWQVETWVGSYEAISAGEVARIDPALADILGRPVSNLETYFKTRPELLR